MTEKTHEEQKEKQRQKCEVYSRTCGYYRPLSNMNDAKRAEKADTKYFKV
jgi:anaerobic ribonucleoside-triphosphate reductase